MHCRQHVADLHQCLKCDRKAMELVEGNHRFLSFQPAEEIYDLYRCTNCGEERILLVRRDP